MSRKRQELKELALAWRRCPICSDPRRFICKECKKPVRDDRPHGPACPHCRKNLFLVCALCMTDREQLNTLAVEKSNAKLTPPPRQYGQRPPSRSFSWKGSPRVKFIH